MIVLILGLSANIAVVLLSLSAAARLSPARGPLDGVVFLLCRYLIIGASLIALGLLRLMGPLYLGVVGLVLINGWFFAREHRRVMEFLRGREFVGWLPAALLAVIGVRALIQAVAFVPYSVDVLSYHLPKVAQWVQQGSLLPYPGADIRETFPAGFELLETWWILFLRHDMLVEVAGLEFLALGMCAVAALAQYAGLRRRAAAFAAVFYGLIPAVSLQATGCMNDAPVAALQLATLSLIVGGAHPAIVLAAIAAGLGVKPTFAAVLPGAAFLFWRERKTVRLSFGQLSWAGAFLAMGLGLGVFWYGLNLLHHGNPLFPVGSLQTVSRGTPASSGLGALFGRLNDLGGSAVYDEADHYTVQFILVAGWGLLAFACGGVGLIAMARRSSPLRRMAAAIAVTVLVALLIAPPGSFYLRFILVAPALGAIAAAYLGESHPRTIPMLALAALFTFVSAIRPADRMPEPRFKDVPPDAKVACLRGTHDDSNGESYLAYGSGLTRTVVYLERAGSVEDLMAQLKSQEVRYVFAQARSGDGSLRQFVLEAAKQGFLTKEASGLYRVVSP